MTRSEVIPGILSLILIGGLPVFWLDTQDTYIYGAMFLPLLAYSSMLVERFLNRYKSPDRKLNWESTWSRCLMVSTISVLAALVSALVALLPLPIWLHVIVASIIAILVFAEFYSRDAEKRGI